MCGPFVLSEQNRVDRSLGYYQLAGFLDADPELYKVRACY